MKILLFILLFTGSAYSEENSDRWVIFTVEDTPKEFFKIEDEKKSTKPTVLEPVALSVESPLLVEPEDNEELVSSSQESLKPVVTTPLLDNKELVSFSQESLKPVITPPPLDNKESVSSSQEIAGSSLNPTVTKSTDEKDPASLSRDFALSVQIPDSETVLEEVSSNSGLAHLDPKPKVDILIIVDNSGSMKFILRGIGGKMQNFKETLDPLDYRIAFLSARVIPYQSKSLMDLEYRGQVLMQQKFLEPETDSQILIDTLVRGKGDKCDKPPYCGVRSEQPIGAFKNYLFSRNSSQFIREESERLAVIIITDNDENRIFEEFQTTAESVEHIFDLRYPDKSKKLTVYTLTILDRECQRDIRRKQIFFREGHFAPTIVELAYKTGGKSFSLCLPSYQVVAEQMVRDFIE